MTHGTEETVVGWVPMLSELPEFTVLTDEFTYFADKFAELPYGILALLATSLKDIKMDEEEEIDPTDYGLYEKMYYFCMGVLLRKENKDLYVSALDIEKLEELLGMFVTKISLLEGYYAGILDAKFIDGAWMFGMTEEQAEKILSIVSRRAING